jgi:hypothetical protein
LDEIEALMPASVWRLYASRKLPEANLRWLRLNRKARSFLHEGSIPPMPLEACCEFEPCLNVSQIDGLTDEWRRPQSPIRGVESWRGRLNLLGECLISYGSGIRVDFAFNASHRLERPGESLCRLNQRSVSIALQNELGEERTFFAMFSDLLWHGALLVSPRLQAHDEDVREFARASVVELVRDSLQLRSRTRIPSLSSNVSKGELFAIGSQVFWAASVIEKQMVAVLLRED